jgi:hypothetical protein
VTASPLRAATALLLAAAASATAAPDSLEYPVKAALLLNFAKFVEWPAGSAQAGSDSVELCVLGRDPFGPLLDSTVSGRTAGGRPITVRRASRVEEMEGCHIVFVASVPAERMRDALASLASQPIVTVGESARFGEHGGVIALVVEENVVRFDVNRAAARQAGLLLSSKLLGLARSVDGHRRGAPE